MVRLMSDLPPPSLSPLDLKIYRRGGLSDAEAKQWAEAGILPYHAESYLAGGLTLAQARAWADAGIAGPDAAKFAAVGLSVSQARSWRRAGFNPGETVSAIRQGKTLRDAKAERTKRGQAERAAAKRAKVKAAAKAAVLNDIAEKQATLLRAATDELWQLSSEGRWGYGALETQDSLPAPTDDMQDIDLYLRVEIRDDGHIVWDVSISEEDAGFSDACFASGEASAVEDAKAACVDAAREWIVDSPNPSKPPRL